MRNKESRIRLSADVSFPLEFVTSKCAILSMQGRGKTHVAKVLAEEMLIHGQQIIYCDPTGVAWGLTSSADGKGEGFSVLVLGGDHGEVPLHAQAGEATADVVVSQRLSVVLDLSAFNSDAEKVRFMTTFCDRLYRRNRRPLHLFLDEADEFIPQNPNADETRMLHVVKRIWQRGRVRGIGGTIISQRSAVVHKTVLSQSSTLIALQTMGPQDRKALISWFDSGWGTETQVAEFKDGIASLPKHQAWIFSPEFNIYAKTKTRPLKTFDSSATPDVEHGALREPEKRAAIGRDRLVKIMKAAIDEAEANDIEKVRHQLRKRDEEAKALAKELDRARNRPEPKPLPVLPAVDPKAIDRAFEQFKRIVDPNLMAAHAAVEKIRSGMLALGMALGDELRRVRESTKNVQKSTPYWKAKATPVPVSDRDGGEDDAEHDYIEALNAPARPFRRPQERSGNGQATSAREGGERRMLVALAQHGTLDRSRWRALAGIPRESSLRTYISRFTIRGWIVATGGGYELTPEGRHVTGTYEPLPRGEALARWWMDQFTGGEGKLIAYLLDHPRLAFEPEILRSEVGGTMTESSFRTYISRLSVAGVIEKDSSGRIQLDSGLREAVA